MKGWTLYLLLLKLTASVSERFLGSSLVSLPFPLSAGRAVCQCQVSTPWLKLLPRWQLIHSSTHLVLWLDQTPLRCFCFSVLLQGTLTQLWSSMRGILIYVLHLIRLFFRGGLGSVIRFFFFFQSNWKKKVFVASEIKNIKTEMAKEKSYLFPFFSAS